MVKQRKESAVPAAYQGTSVSARPSANILEPTEELYINVEETGNYIVIPPDGGWGWVIVLTAFLTFTFTDGLSYSFGLLMKDISHELMVSVTMVSLTSSLLTAEVFLMGPIFCALINHYGFRLVAIIGAVGSIACVLSSSYAPNFPTFVMLMGVACGVFMSMSYISSCIIVGFYFERWRALATAISVSGSAAGVVVVPLILQLLTDYTWRQKLRVVSGILGIIVLAALTYRPIAPTRVERNDGPIVQQKLEILKKIGINEPDVSSIFDYDAYRSSTTWNNIHVNKQHNLRYPTAADVYGGGNVVISQMTPSEFHITNQSMISEYNRVSDHHIDNAKKLWHLDCNFCHKKLKRNDTKMLIATRPLYREDILFFGPLSRLEKYKKTKAMRDGSSGMTNYHMEVTRLAAYQDLLDQQAAKCICCPQAIVRILSTMFDMNILRHCSSTIFMFTGFFTAAGMFAPFIYVTEMNIAAGLSVKTSTTLLSVIGFTNILGRILCGVVSVFPKIKAIIVMEVCLIISGIIVILMPFFPNVYVQYTCGCIFGLTIAVNAALRPIVIVDLYGLEKLTNAFGIAMLFQGVACCIGIPVAGVLKDITGSYHALMIFAGSCLTISGLLMLPVQPLAKREKYAEFSKKFLYDTERFQSLDNGPSSVNFTKQPWSWNFNKETDVQTKDETV